MKTINLLEKFKKVLQGEALPDDELSSTLEAINEITERYDSVYKQICDEMKSDNAEMDEEDSDDPMDNYVNDMKKCTAEIAAVYFKQGHSGMSHSFTKQLINQYLSHKTMKKFEIGDEYWGDDFDGNGTQQHKLFPSVFKKNEKIYDIDRVIGCSPGDDGEGWVTWTGHAAYEAAEKLGVGYVNENYVPGDEKIYVYFEDEENEEVKKITRWRKRHEETIFEKAA